MKAMTKLVNWFNLQCDGDWEHGDGIKISTLDNPGWMVDISLEGTGLEEKDFVPFKIDRSEDDWLRCIVEGKRFRIACGPSNLEEGLEQFLEWAGYGEDTGTN
jgi:hypothetical protein